MKVVILFLFTISCAAPSSVSKVITPTTKIQIAYFWIQTEDGRQYFLNAVNFIDTGDMWILYTKAATEEPEFLDVFQIDSGHFWYSPFSSKRGISDMSAKDYIADLFVKSSKQNVERIKRIGFYEF